MLHLDRLTVLAGILVVGVLVAIGLLVAPPDENRELVPFPGPQDALTLRNDALSQGAAALEERSGLRSVGVRAEAWFRTNVEQEAVFERHVRGDDGWLFLRWPVEGACGRASIAARLAPVVERLGRVGAAAGIEVAVIVPPDKPAIVTEHLGQFGDAGVCLADQAAAIDALPAPAVGVLDEVRNVVAEAGGRADAAYYVEDTHWRFTSGAAASRPVIARLAPRLLDTLVVEQDGSHDQEMDLARFGGREVRVSDRVLALRPPGASIVERVDANGLERIRSGGSALVPERHVVFVRDSYGAFLLPSLAHLGTTTVVCNCEGHLDRRVRDDLATAEALVLQVVQRNSVGSLVGGDAAGQLAVLLGDRLASRPLTVGPDGAVTLPESGAVRFGFEGVPQEVYVAADDGSGGKAIPIVDGVVGALFVEDLGTRDVRVTTDGPAVISAEAIALD